MNRNDCDCTISCTGISVLISIIIGIITAILRYTAVITVTPAFLWVLLGIAIGFLGITLLTSVIGRGHCCDFLNTFLTGILGTVLASIILLGITFAATSIIGAIISGALLFFFSLMITTATCLINCRNNCN